MTSDTINLGAVDTLTGPVPGFGQSSASAAQAYVAYRNSTGGVCGRKLSLKVGDDGADSGQNRAVTQELAAKVVGFAGSIGIGDDGGATIIEAGKIPYVGIPVNPSMYAVSTAFNMNPGYADVHHVTPKYKYLVSQGARKVALVWITGAAGRQEIEQKQKPLMEAAGLQVVLDQQVPLSTLSYDSYARRVANSGADYMFFLNEEGADASMAQALADINYKLKFAEYLTAYGSNFIRLAGSAGAGAVSWINTLPNEDGGANAEQAAFLKWYGQAAPNRPPDTFAANAWVSAKAFVDALATLPGPITRQAIDAKLAATGTYDAGGMLGPIQLGKKINNGCQVGMQVVNGQWKRLAPSQGFLC